MEKCYHLNAQAQEEEEFGGFVDNPYPFHSSSPLGFPSLQSITQHKPLLPLLFNNTYQTSTSLISHPLPISNTPLICDYYHLRPDSSLQSLTNSTTLKLPKTEPTDFHNISDQPPLFHLPNSPSLEQNPDTVPKLDIRSPYQLNSPLSPRLKYERQREIGRRRRQRVREKIESLKELVPTHKKRMDTATLLENAGKYIKFLEAQVGVLEAMAVDDCLDRNRVLQMMVNSELIQGKMSSQGMCVYSVEQLVEIIGRLFTSDEAYVLLNSILFSTCAPY